MTVDGGDVRNEDGGARRGPPATAVDWWAYEPAAFAAAAREDRPILLSLTATWCRDCHAMDRAVYADPDLGERIDRAFVPIRVDVDRRPRVSDRYAVGGVPSTVFLTPVGEVLTGASALAPETFRDVLARVEELWRERGDRVGRIPRAVRSDPPTGAVEGVERAVASRLRSRFDPDHGGWGTDRKYPLPGAIEFALTREPELASRTLAPIRQHLHDTYDGGFFRFAAERDWSDPRREKLATVNGALLRTFANAYLHTGDDAYRETAADVVDFLTTTLWTGEGVAGSQAPAAPEYYRRTPSERAAVEVPPVDRTVFADRNAIVLEGLLTYHASTGDAAARGFAERTVETLAGLVDGGTVRHYAAPGAPEGLLVDQATVARATAMAAQVLDRDHETTAVAVADDAIRTLRTDVGFTDGPTTGPGLLDRPFYPIDAAATLANAFVDVAALTGEERYRDAARHALSAFGGARDRLVPGVASYATAAARLADVLRIEVATPPGTDLHRAALRIPDHEKVVVPDATGPPPGTAVVEGQGRRADPASTPEALHSRVAGFLP